MIDCAPRPAAEFMVMHGRRSSYAPRLVSTSFPLVASVQFGRPAGRLEAHVCERHTQTWSWTWLARKRTNWTAGTCTMQMDKQRKRKRASLVFLCVIAAAAAFACLSSSSAAASAHPRAQIGTKFIGALPRLAGTMIGFWRAHKVGRCRIVKLTSWRELECAQKITAHALICSAQLGSARLGSAGVFAFQTFMWRHKEKSRATRAQSFVAGPKGKQSRVCDKLRRRPKSVGGPASSGGGGGGAIRLRRPPIVCNIKRRRRRQISSKAIPGQLSGAAQFCARREPIVWVVSRQTKSARH